MPKKLDPTNAARQARWRSRRMMVLKPIPVEPESEPKQLDPRLERLIAMLADPHGTLDPHKLIQETD